ncbi:MAG: NAD(P)/FAD-dependent oxidoreductase [Parvibaculales bacterium]
MVTQLETDYLIIGSGAMGMAFADTLLDETQADMIIIDRHAKPGGHWNVAYPFVRLHQPSSFYGVPSKELSRFEKDKVGLNKGLFDLASGPEVSAYYDDVMQQHFLASGRVRYFPMCEYDGDGVFRSLTGGQSYEVKYKKLVDATRLTVDVPAEHTPAFSIADGVNFMPLNGLPRLRQSYDGFTVIGSGKTGMDACLWLLQTGVDPDAIRWIMPRDAWMLPREYAQNDMEFFTDVFGNQANQFEAIAGAESIDDMYDRLEAAGCVVRFDPTVRPEMFHAATVSQLELEQLRRIKNVIRMGRVQALEADRIVLDDGEIETGPGQLHVDCSASLARTMVRMSPKPVFDGNVITPQTVRSFMPVFSGSVIAHVETHYDSEEEKNRLCAVVPLPNTAEDFVPMTLAAMLNQYNWSQEKELRAWVRENRLDGFTKLTNNVPPEDEEKMAILMRMRDTAPKTVAKLMELAATIEA